MTPTPTAAARVSGTIKACPFCGSLSIKESSDGWGNVFHKCTICRARGPSRRISLSDPSPHQADWDKRAAIQPDPEPQPVEMSAPDCPFCGGRDVERLGDAMHCYRCGAYGPKIPYSRDDKAWTWASRATPSSAGHIGDGNKMVEPKPVSGLAPRYAKILAEVQDSARRLREAGAGHLIGDPATPPSAGMVSVEAVMREIHRFAAERKWHPSHVTELVTSIGNLRALDGDTQ